MELILTSAAVGISALAFLVSIYTHWSVMRRDRKQATLDAYNRLEEQALEPLDKYMPAQIKEIAQKPRSEEYKAITAYIARIEHFCVGVNQKIYDRDVVYALAHGFLDGRILSRIVPILEKKQQGAKESYYANTEEVLTWMKQHGARNRKAEKK